MHMPVRRKANVAPMELPFGRSREPLPTQHTTRTRTQPTAGMARTTRVCHEKSKDRQVVARGSLEAEASWRQGRLRVELEISTL